MLGRLAATSRESTPAARAAPIRLSTPVDKLGVPSYDELVLVAQRKRLEEDPEGIRLFLAALARDKWPRRKNPKARTTKALLEAEPRPRSEADQAEVRRPAPASHRR